MNLSSHSQWFALSLTCALLAPPARAAEPIPLRAGPVTMSFDADNVFLRHIRVGSHEVLRGINAPIRDRNWATAAPKVSDVRVEKDKDHFKVTFNVTCAEDGLDFRWKGSLTGNAKGEIAFTFDGEAFSTFKRNRIGFCVLHGPSAAGKSWVLETADGETSKGRFPTFISAHQPAKNIRTLTHEVAPGIHAKVEFEGEVFEMEDQRNWTDGSFKTYCTPLSIPYPVEIAKGTKVSQKIKISLAGKLPDPPQPGASETVLTLSEKESAIPRLGVQLSSVAENLTGVQLDRLKALHLDHLRVDLALSNKAFVKNLRRGTEQAKALGVSLQVGLDLGNSPAFETLVDEIKKLNPPVSHWLVIGGTPAHFEQARKQLAAVAGTAKFGDTRITNFVDLNRARPTDPSIEVVGFAINPQVHAFDNTSMMETLPIHADVVNSARQFVGNRPLAIGPITLRPQFINGQAQPGGPPAGTFPKDVDVRQVTPFAAAWTLGSLKYLAEAGAQSATYYETVGWKGFMEVDDVGSRTTGYPSRPGEVFPVYELFKEIGAFVGGTMRQFDSSDSQTAVAIALQKDGRKRVVVANLTGEPQAITLRGFGEPTRLTLPSYGITYLDR